MPLRCNLFWWMLIWLTFTQVWRVLFLTPGFVLNPCTLPSLLWVLIKDASVIYECTFGFLLRLSTNESICGQDLTQVKSGICIFYLSWAWSSILSSGKLLLIIVGPHCQQSIWGSMFFIASQQSGYFLLMFNENSYKYHLNTAWEIKSPLHLEFIILSQVDCWRGLSSSVSHCHSRKRNTPWIAPILSALEVIKQRFLLCQVVIVLMRSSITNTYKINVPYGTSDWVPGVALYGTISAAGFFVSYILS